MPKFSNRSIQRLVTCDKQLQDVMGKVIDVLDITILEGIRSEERQDELYRQGKSRLQYPNSKHNVKDEGGLSRAVDIAPWISGRGIDWSNTEHFHYMAGIVLGIASQMNVKIRWGGDWNRNQYSGDEQFLDMVHFELD